MAKLQETPQSTKIKQLKAKLKQDLVTITFNNIWGGNIKY